MNITISAQDLKNALEFSATDKVRPALAGVNIQIEGDQIIISSTDSYRANIIKTKSIPGNFPDVEKFIPEGGKEMEIVEFTLERLIQHCKEAIALQKKQAKIMLGDHIKIWSGSQWYDCPGMGLIFNCVLNPNYLLPILKQVNTRAFTMSQKDPLSPFIIKFGNTTHMIMPIKS